MSQFSVGLLSAIVEVYVGGALQWAWRAYRIMRRCISICHSWHVSWGVPVVQFPVFAFFESLFIFLLPFGITKKPPLRTGQPMGKHKPGASGPAIRAWFAREECVSTSRQKLDSITGSRRAGVWE